MLPWLPISTNTNLVGIQSKPGWFRCSMWAFLLSQISLCLKQQRCPDKVQSLGALTAGICPQYTWLHINLACDRHKHEKTKTRTKCNSERKTSGNYKKRVSGVCSPVHSF